MRYFVAFLLVWVCTLSYADVIESNIIEKYPFQTIKLTPLYDDPPFKFSFTVISDVSLGWKKPNYFFVTKIVRGSEDIREITGTFSRNDKLFYCFQEGDLVPSIVFEVDEFSIISS